MKNNLQIVVCGDNSYGWWELRDGKTVLAISFKGYSSKGNAKRAANALSRRINGVNYMVPVKVENV